MRKVLIAMVLIVMFLVPAAGDDPWIVPVDSLIYREIEELYITSGKVAPFKEKPVIAESLIQALQQYRNEEKDVDKLKKAEKILGKLRLPSKYISPILETALQGFWNSETDRFRYLTGNDSSLLIDYQSMYDNNKIPSLLKFGFIAYYEGFSLLFEPELRPTLYSLYDNNNYSNLPVQWYYFDFNIPYRGIATYYKSPLEVRFGRDKLHLGPSRWSTLTLSQYVPYFDYGKVEYFTNTLSLGLYLVQLNATITAEESQYLEDMHNGLIPNPEENADWAGKAYIDRYKHYALARLSLLLAPWWRLNITQTDLIAGRFPLLSDINPLGVYHNNFAEGVYSVPLSINTSMTPLPGVNLYIDFLFYDAVLGDEVGISKNATAMAYQGGLSLISTPYFTLGPGRLRLDGEVTLTDPWIYGKYYNLRKFTTRIIYECPAVGRFWVDYPLGFYTGPDTFDLNLALSYGIPGEWEAELSWNRNGNGSIDLYGWGDGTDYSHIGESDAYPLTGAPTGLVQWTDKIQCSFYYCPVTNLKLTAWYTLKSVLNRYHVEGDNQIFHNVGIGAEWKVY